MQETIAELNRHIDANLENSIKALVYIFNQENESNVEFDDLNIEEIKERIIDEICSQIEFVEK